MDERFYLGAVIYCKQSHCLFQFLGIFKGKAYFTMPHFSMKTCLLKYPEEITTDSIKYLDEDLFEKELSGYNKFFRTSELQKLQDWHYTEILTHSVLKSSDSLIKSATWNDVYSVQVINHRRCTSCYSASRFTFKNLGNDKKLKQNLLDTFLLILNRNHAWRIKNYKLEP